MGSRYSDINDKNCKANVGLGYGRSERVRCDASHLGVVSRQGRGQRFGMSCSIDADDFYLLGGVIDCFAEASTRRRGVQAQSN
jgi:hypothetical protein